MYRLRLFPLLLLFFCTTASTQTLLKDAQNLAQALSVFETEIVGTQLDSAQAQALAILSFYASEPGELDPQILSYSDLVSLYTNNSSLSTYLQDLQSANRLLAQQMLTSLSQNHLRNTSLQKLYAEQTSSPADYLSVMKTVTDYQKVPFSDLQALQISTQQQSTNRSSSVLNQQAIIEGLFLFLTERAGEEIMVTFLQRLLNKEITAFQELFPTVFNS